MIVNQVSARSAQASSTPTRSVGDQARTVFLRTTHRRLIDFEKAVHPMTSSAVVAGVGIQPFGRFESGHRELGAHVEEPPARHGDSVVPVVAFAFRLTAGAE